MSALEAGQPKVRTCLWMAGTGREASEFYVSLLPDSRIESSSPMVIVLRLGGAPYMILNAGPAPEPSAAASISVRTADQAETDGLWERLTADGGVPGRCGWLVDRWGVSWKIVPDALPRLLGSDDPAAAQRVQEAMLGMGRIDVAALQAAHDAWN